MHIQTTLPLAARHTYSPPGKLRREHVTLIPEINTHCGFSFNFSFLWMHSISLLSLSMSIAITPACFAKDVYGLYRMTRPNFFFSFRFWPPAIWDCCPSQLADEAPLAARGKRKCWGVPTVFLPRWYRALACTCPQGWQSWGFFVHGSSWNPAHLVYIGSHSPPRENGSPYRLA